MKPREHGTQTKYIHDKCKCDLCRAANTAAVSKYRATVKLLKTSKGVKS